MFSDGVPREPIAIIGTGCRFPGEASSPSRLWELLKRPRDLLREIPQDRFNGDGFYHPDPEYHGNSNTKHSYFLDENVREFDAQFFGVKPVEANAIDPQQRVLLEVVYEAIEAAGKPMESLRGSDTSVYVGCSLTDYDNQLSRDVDNQPTYQATGTHRSIVANRISYFFDWNGPSMTIDTACSSSLVALHQAVQNLRQGESKVAVVGGTNLILGPEVYMAESQLRMLSPTGRSRMFDADADGYARGEGVAAVVLKTLSAAVEAGDPIECIIRETGVNQDGRTNGITMPSPASQVKLIRQVYRNAGLDPTNVDDRCQYFECHGTGTPAGDPVEAQAISEAFFDPKDLGERRRCSIKPEPLYVGSIKTVIGHTEATAGLAGLIKASLALQHAIVPPNMLFRRLNPNVAPFYAGLGVPLAPLCWPKVKPGQPRRASVNSFGFGGTNAHLILESYEGPQHSRGEVDNRVNGVVQILGSDDVGLPAPLVLSANSQHSLRRLIKAHLVYLRANADSLNLGQFLSTIARNRSVFGVRKTFSGPTINALVTKLEAAANHPETNIGIETNNKPSGSRSGGAKILGIFTGQGAQWPAMGRELLLRSALARARLHKLDARLQALPDAPAWSLSQTLLDGDENISEAYLSQPLCTAVQILLVDVLAAAGVRFHAVVGHSSGEMAAAYAAGYLTAEDAICTAYYRGVYAGRAGGPDGQTGRMMAVVTSCADAQELCGLPHFRGRICVAAHNAPDSVTLSGDEDAILEARAALEDEDKTAKLLFVDTAYHSHHMLSCSEAYKDALSGLGLRFVVPGSEESKCKWVSSVYGEEAGRLASLARLDPVDYWNANMVGQVLFAGALEKACADYGPFEAAVEVGPHPALKRPALTTIEASKSGQKGLPYTGVLQRGKNDAESVADALGYLWSVLGDASVVDFQGYWEQQQLHDGAPCSKSSGLKFLPPLKDLPSYPWDKEGREYWHESRLSRVYRSRSEPTHVLLGNQLPDGTHGREYRWRNYLSPKEVPWLDEHQVQGQAVFPAAGYAIMAVEAAALLLSSLNDGHAGKVVRLVEILDMSIQNALAFPADNTAVETLFTLTNVVQQQQASKDGSGGSVVIVQACFCLYAALNQNADSLSPKASGVLKITLGEASSEVLPMRGSTSEPNMVQVDSDRFYDSLANVGFGYTGHFRGLQQLERKAGFSTGLIRNHSSLQWDVVEGGQTPGRKLLVHPAFLDVAFQAIMLAYCYPDDGRLWAIHVPRAIKSIRINPALCAQHLSQNQGLLPFEAAETYCGQDGVVGDVDIYSPASARSSSDNADTTQFGMIQVQGLHFVPFTEASTENDTRIFSTTVWGPASPDLAAVCSGQRATAEEYDLAADLERVCLFYMNAWEREIPQDHPARTDGPYRGLFHYMAHVRGRVSSGQHRYARPEYMEDDEDVLRRLQTKHKASLDMMMVDAVGQNMPAVIRGETTMLEHLFKDDLLSRYYSGSLGMKTYTRFLARAVKQLTHRYPSMNILEVGAGTGHATKQIFREIGDSLASYHFTDVSSGFFENAQAVFTDVFQDNKMVFKVLDMEKDIISQGFEPGSFDLVVASFVLHITDDLASTLHQVRRLLKPGGYLLLAELTDNEPMRSGFCFGSLPGWWKGEGDGRDLSPCVAPVVWDALLRQTGFSGVDSVSDDLDPLPWPASIIASQAVDEDIALLREPLTTAPGLFAQSSSSHINDSIVIIGGLTLQTARLVQQIRSLVAPMYGNVTLVKTVDAVLQDSTLGSRATTVLNLSDLDEPLFANLTQEKLQGLRAVLERARTVVWVTEGRRSKNPYMNMSVGFGRSMMWEIPGLNLHYVDLFATGEPEQETCGHGRGARLAAYKADEVATALLQFDVSAKWKAEGKKGTDRMLWSVEWEVEHDAEGRVLIPRLVENKEANQRYNSSRRVIRETVDPSAVSIVAESLSGASSTRERPQSSSPSMQLVRGETVDSLRKQVQSTGTSPAFLVHITYSSTLCVPIGKQSHLYLVYGQVDGCGTGEYVFGLSEHVASSVVVAHDMVAKAPSSLSPCLMELVMDELVTANLVSGLTCGDTLVVVEPPARLASRLSDVAGGLNIHASFLSISEGVEDSSTAKRQLGQDWIHLPAHSRQRDLARRLPRAVDRFVNLSTGGEDSSARTGDFVRAVEGLLPRACEVRQPVSVYSTTACLSRFDKNNGLSSILQGAVDRASTLVQGPGRAEEAVLQPIPVAELDKFLPLTENTPQAIIAWKQQQQHSETSTATEIPISIRPADSTPLFRPDRSYWLVGLTRDLGLSLTEWMIRLGARHIILSSRNPTVDPVWLDRVQTLGPPGIHITLLACDVTSLASVQHCYARIVRDGPPLAGVAQAAMVLRDALVSDMDVEKMGDVLGPKVQGSLILEAVLLPKSGADDGLDFFVYFSSMAGLVGNLGQSNYSAANAFMMSRARARRARGLAASVINIGVIVGVGYITREVSQATLEDVREGGYMWLPEQAFHAMFAEAVIAGRKDSLLDPEISTGVARVGAWETRKPIWFHNPRFSHHILHADPGALGSRGGEAVMGGNAVSLQALLRDSTTSEEVSKILQDAFMVKLQNLLKFNPAEGRSDAAVLALQTSDLGIDSLIAVEIRKWFLKELAVNIAVLKILGGASIEDILDDAVSQLSKDSTPNLGHLTNGHKKRTEESTGRGIADAVSQTGAKKDTSKSLPPIPPPASKEKTTGRPAGACSSEARPGIEANETNGELHPRWNGKDKPVKAAAEPQAENVDQELDKSKSIGQSTRAQRSGPLSHGQLMFWLVDLLSQDPTTLNHTAMYRVQGRLRTADLQRAFTKVVLRHEILRTCFHVDTEDQPTQTVLQRPRVQLEVKSLEEGEDISRILEEVKSHVFDLEQGQALRLVLVGTSNPQDNFLVCGCHHIIVDGASQMVLMRDLEKAYQGESLGPNPLQYLDFTALQKREAENGAWDKSLAYWKDTFHGPTVRPIPILPLPGAAPARRTLSVYQFHRVSVSLPPQLTSAIDQASRTLQATPFHFYLAAFRVLLVRLLDMRQYMENDDTDVDSSSGGGFNIGIASNNRTDETASCIGPFVNLLPLHFPPIAPHENGTAGTSTTTFADVVRDTRHRTLQALSHSAVPFGAVLDALGHVPRSADHSPLFQTFVDYREGGSSTSMTNKFADLRLEAVEACSTGRTAYDVNLDITRMVPSDDEGGCRLEVMLQSSLYSASDARVFLDCYRSVLKVFSREPLAEHLQQSVFRPGIFPAESVAAAVALGRGPVVASAWGKNASTTTLVYRVRDVASGVFGTSEAVRDGFGRTFTYEQLWRRVLSIAGGIEAALGARFEGEGPRMVAVFQERTSEWICSVLAIWLVGHVYVPVDTSLPMERLSQIILDCKPVLVVTDAANADTASGLLSDRLGQASSVLSISTIPPSEDKSDGWVDTKIHARSDDAAVVFYTSGSTGTAKGIILRHSSLANEVEFSAQSYGIGQGERVLQQSNLGFDMSLTQIFSALAFGGCVFVCPTASLGSPLEISRIMERERITVTCGTPSEYISWLTTTHGLSSSEVNANLKSSPWRVAISGGEPVTPSLIQAFRSLGASRPSSGGQDYLQLFNAYGPTEVTCSSSRCRVPYNSQDDDDLLTWPVLPAGYTAPNARVTIVDRNLHPLPVGFRGEIAVAGAGVAMGYLGRPEETGRRFVCDGSSGSRLLHRTADVGRLLPDGRLVVLGRIAGDTQVKLPGGIRVDLREVEYAIVRAAGLGCVLEAVASVRPTATATASCSSSSSAEDILVAHVVFSSTTGIAGNDEQARVDSIQGALVSLLPRRMVPSLIIPVDALPRGATGKTDRRAVGQLPLPVAGGDSAAVADFSRAEVALTPDEERLGELWAQILPREVVGARMQHMTARSDFFRLGGSSLLLLQLQRLVEDEFDVRLSLPDLFGASSLAGMTALVCSSSTRSTSPVEKDHPHIDWACEMEDLVKELLRDVDILADDTDQQQQSPIKPQPEVIILTGATGQLGTKLLHLLLQTPTIKTIHCLAVRHPHKLPLGHPKIRIHPGDLSHPLLGLPSPAHARSLFRDADVVIHNAALVSHLQPYHALRRQNVLATVLLARLARPRGLPVHYVSSAGVSLYYSAAAPVLVDGVSVEFGPGSVAGYAPDGDGVDGYVASKWASECVLERLGRVYASCGGVECAAATPRRPRVFIHRPSHIQRQWNLDAGSSHGENVLENLLQLCKIMRTVPRSSRIMGFMNLVDLQKCAEGIVEAVLRQQEEDETLGSRTPDEEHVSEPVRYIHHLGDENVPLHDLKAYVEQDGKGEVEVVGVEEWTGLARASGLSVEHASYLVAVDKGDRKYLYPMLVDG